MNSAMVDRSMMMSCAPSSMPMSSMPGMPAMSPMMGNMCMVVRCTMKLEKCDGGMKMVCKCDDEMSAATLQNMCEMMAGGMCSCCCMMNGMMMCQCNMAMCNCKCTKSKNGVTITCTSGDKECCDMIQACCECLSKCMEAGCVCCVCFNGMPCCCGTC